VQWTLSRTLSHEGRSPPRSVSAGIDGVGSCNATSRGRGSQRLSDKPSPAEVVMALAKPDFVGKMELAGLEPATSWVRSSRPVTSKELRLQRFVGDSLECRNISRNSLHRVLQRHEILDRSAGATEKERGRAPPW